MRFENSNIFKIIVHLENLSCSFQGTYAYLYRKKYGFGNIFPNELMGGRQTCPEAHESTALLAVLTPVQVSPRPGGPQCRCAIEVTVASSADELIIIVKTCLIAIDCCLGGR